MTDGACRRRSGRRFPVGANGWMNPSPVRDWDCRSWSTLPRSTAAAYRLAVRPSAACERNWCSPAFNGPDRFGGAQLLNDFLTRRRLRWGAEAFCRFRERQSVSTAHGPDIDRAAEGLSRAASAAVAGAADAGVRARHRTRPGYGRCHARAGTTAQLGAPDWRR